MNKKKENKKALLRTVSGMMEETNLCRNSLMQVAENAEAIVRFGKRGIRIDSDRFYDFLRKGVR